MTDRSTTRIQNPQLLLLLELFGDCTGYRSRLQVEYFTDANNEADLNLIRMNNKMKRAVLSGLAHFAPRQSLEIILAILEQEHAVDLQRLAEDINPLRSALTKMFGNGSSIVEERIAQDLAREIGIEYEGSPLDAMVTQLTHSKVAEAINNIH